jgi:fatty acid amide hydrolase
MAATEQGELIGLPAGELASLIASRRVSAREAVSAHIERIESLDGKLRAVVVPLFEQALGEAAEADRTNPEGRPLHGVPVTVKESYDVRGTPSTLGASSRRAQQAEEDAELVARLRAAGAIVVGKTNVSQLLLYVEADNPVYGRTNNPWNLDRTPGGSSGGEGAALAAGYSALGLGTDIGGSVRVPAHFCGICSLKPTPDRLNLRGMVADPLFRDSGIRDAAGPLARRVGDLHLAMTALGSPVSEASAKGLRIGVYDDDGYFRRRRQSGARSTKPARRCSQAAAPWSRSGFRISPRSCTSSMGS